MLLERVRATLKLAGILPALIRHSPRKRYTVGDRIEERADEHAERAFLLFEGRRLTYREFNARCNRVTWWAGEQGLCAGDVVALLMENRPEYLETWGGLCKRGVVTALINTNLTGRALDHALRTSRARHLVVGAELLEQLESASPETRAGLSVWVQPDGPPPETLPAGARDLGAALEDAPTRNPDASIRADLVAGDELFYIYTSGTTGNPKAARFSHLRFLAGGDGFAWALGTTCEDVEQLVLPLYHTAGGVVAVGRALHAGAAIALFRRFSASRFWDDARKQGATTFQYIGELCRYLLAQPPRDNDRDQPIRVAVGNGMRPDIWTEFQERFGIERIVEFYGATEGNTGFMNFDGKVGAVGRFPFEALTNARIVRYDVDAETHPRDEKGFCIRCGPGEPGELIGKVPDSRLAPQGQFEGYTSKEESDRKILRGVFEEGDAWFRSGDLLYRDDEGYYYFVDRIGDTFRWKGENVSTQEVAETLAGFPGLDMINVYGVQVPHADGRAGMMAFVPAGDAPFDGRAFFAFVEEALPRYAAPVFVRALREAEVTGTFKLRKVDLQREGFDPSRISDPVYVRDDGAGVYRPLDPETAAEIESGARRL